MDQTHVSSVFHYVKSYIGLVKLNNMNINKLLTLFVQQKTCGTVTLIQNQATFIAFYSIESVI